MDMYQQKLDQLDSILQTHKLGYIYDFLNDRGNGLILPFFSIHMDSLNKIGLDFSITTDSTARAGIIYDKNLVFISQGLIDKLSKLTELIYISGAINGVKKDIRYHDLHFVETLLLDSITKMINLAMVNCICLFSTISLLLLFHMR